MLSVATVTATPAAAYGSTIEVTGHGWGHGRGAGQWGSLGYAVDDSRPYSWILDHYYGGTTKAARSESLMTVNLAAIEDRDLIVTSGSNFQIDPGTDPPDGNLTITVTAGRALRVRHTGDGWAVDESGSCGGAGGWQLQKFYISPSGDATYSSSSTPRIGTAYTGDDVTKMIRVCDPYGNVRSYRGIVNAFPKLVGSWAVNTLPTELYLRGVVPRESPDYWGGLGGGKGMEALKTQAVAARSYALSSQWPNAPFKVQDDTRSQVYGGAALGTTPSESPNANAAIAATAGEIRQDSNSNVARTEFSSSTGGYTAGGTFTAVPDDGDDVCLSQSTCNGNHNWSATIATSAVQNAYPSIGTLQAINVLSRNGLGADGGRVTSIKLTGSSGTTTTTGAGFAGKLGLKSDWFSISSLSVARVAGTTRLATAVAESMDSYPAADSAQAVVLVSAEKFPDALVATPLAVQKNGPVLLTYSTGLDAATANEINRVLPSGGTVYVIGGTAVIPDSVANQLAGAGYDVQRLAGPTRYSTAVKVAEALGNPTTIFEVTGQNFPDGLAAGAAAAKKGGALLLTIDSHQASETANYLQGRPVTRYAVGGAAAAADPGANTKIVGSDRYDTAVKLAIALFPYPQVAGLASGDFPWDGLSGGAHAVKKGGPLVLTTRDPLSTPTKNYFASALISSLSRVVVYGGPGAISDQVVSEISAL
jgi:SpoIID/LytB domain protein